MLVYHYMKKLFMLMAGLALMACACSGNDDSSTQSVQDMLLQPPKVVASLPYTIMGKVTCKACKTTDQMWIEIKDEADTNFLTTEKPAWRGNFGDGSFKVVPLIIPNTNYLVRISVGSVCPAGCPLQSYTSPAGNADPIQMKITID